MDWRCCKKHETLRAWLLEASRGPAAASIDSNWSGQAAALEDETRPQLQLTRAAEPRG